MGDGQVVIDVTADDAGFKRVVSGLGSAAQAGLGGIGRTLAGLGVAIGRTALAAAGIAAVFAGAALKKGWDRLTTIQNATKSLTLLLGSATKAAALMGQVLGVVQGTPFSLSQFADAAQNLVAFNVPLQKIPGILTAIADAAAATGGKAETVNQLNTVFGQMAARGKVQLEDVWSLSEAGVPALQILANAYGVTTDEMAKMISDPKSGGIAAAHAIDVLTKGIENGSKGANGATRAFAGLAKTLGEGLSGSLDNAGIAMARMGAGIIAPFEKQIVSFLKNTANAFDAMGAVMNGDPLGEAKLTTSLNNMGALFAEVGTKMLPPLIMGITAMLTTIASALPAVLSALAPSLISGVVAIIVALATAIPPLLPILATALLNGIMSLAEKLPAAIPSFIDAFAKIITRTATMLPALVGVLIVGFIALLKAVIAVMPVVIPALVQGFVGVLVALANAMPTLAPMLMTAFVAILNALTSVLPVVIPLLVQAFTLMIDALNAQMPTIMPPLVAAFVQLIVALTPPLVEALIKMLPYLVQASAFVFLGLAMVIAQVYGPKLQAAAVTLLGGLIIGFNNKVGAVIGWLSGLPGRMVAAVGSLASRLVSQASAFIGGLVTGFNNKLGAVLSWLGQLPGRMARAIGSLGGTLVAAGRALMDGLLAGIRAAWEAVAGYLSGLAAKIKRLKGPIEKDRVLLVDEGRAIMAGLQRGLVEGWSPVEKLLNGYTGMFENSFGPRFAAAMAVAPGGVLPPAYRFGASGGYAAAGALGSSTAASNGPPTVNQYISSPVVSYPDMVRAARDGARAAVRR